MPEAFYEAISSHTAHDAANRQSVVGTNRLRILIPSYRSAPHSGGQGVYVHHLSKALARLGHKVDVISGPPYPKLDPSVRLVKLPSLDLHAAKNGLLAFRWRFLTSFTDFYEWFSHNTGAFPEPYTFGRRLTVFMQSHGMNYDVVHDNQSLSWDLLKLQRQGTPIVATIHHPITRDVEIALQAEPSFAMRCLIRRWHSFLQMQMKVSRKLANLVAVSESTSRDIQVDFGVDQDRIEVIHNGVDTDIFRPLPNVKRRQNRLFATASADVPLKGLVHLLKAYHLLLDDYPDLELVVLSKPRNGPTARLLHELGISDRVQFISGLTDEQLVQAYAETTIAICPSVYEGFGFPAAEAMACAVPVIATTGGALPEVVGPAGVLTPVADPEAIAVAVRSLLEDPSQRTDLGRQARERILRNFTWDRAAKSYETKYLHTIAHAHSQS